LSEFSLNTIPEKVFSIANLRTLDLSKNNLKILSNRLSELKKIKFLNCDKQNKGLDPGSIHVISTLSNLQNFSCAENRLGKREPDTTNGLSKHTPSALPDLPLSIKQLNLNSNFFSSFPPQIIFLSRLEKLDLSKNNLITIPAEISNLVSLTDLNLDQNSVVALPEEIGTLKKLKSLSLQYNGIHVHSTSFSEKNPQPLPALLFTSTPIIDLKLTGNQITNTQLNEFIGFPDFLKRRQDVKTKNIYGGAMTNLSVCGLE